MIIKIEELNGQIIKDIDIKISFDNSSASSVSSVSSVSSDRSFQGGITKIKPEDDFVFNSKPEDNVMLCTKTEDAIIVPEHDISKRPDKVDTSMLTEEF